MFLSLLVFTLILTNPHSLLAVAVVIWVSTRQSLLATCSFSVVADPVGRQQRRAWDSVCKVCSCGSNNLGFTQLTQSNCRLASSVLSVPLYLLHCTFTVSFVCLNTHSYHCVSVLQHCVQSQAVQACSPGAIGVPAATLNHFCLCKCTPMVRFSVSPVVKRHVFSYGSSLNQSSWGPRIPCVSRVPGTRV